MTRAGEGQLSLFPPEPAPDPLLCWLWLAGTLGAGSQRAGAVLDAFGGAQEASSFPQMLSRRFEGMMIAVGQYML